MKEATKPASYNFLKQQQRFDHFVGIYNKERSHQALDGRLSSRAVYTLSAHLPRSVDLVCEAMLPTRNVYGSCGWHEAVSNS